MPRILRGARTLPLTAGFALACVGSSGQPRVATTPAAAPNAISFGASDRLIGVPVPTDGRYSVRVYGAKGDGVTIDSDAINRAIDAAAAAGGGTVVFPAGTYASHSIRLKSHVGLYLDQGAVLLAADTGGGRGYDPAERGPGNAFQDFGHSHWHNSLIWGENLEDVSITGPGRIDGEGLSRGLNPRAGISTRVPARRTRRSRSSARATCCSATSRSIAAGTCRSCSPAWTTRRSTT